MILEIVGQKSEATVAEICAHSDLPRPTAYRLVNDLTEAGLLDPVSKGRSLSHKPIASKSPPSSH